MTQTIEWVKRKSVRRLGKIIYRKSDKTIEAEYRGRTLSKVRSSHFHLNQIMFENRIFMYF